MGSDAGEQHIGRPQPLAGQAQKKTNLARAPRQEIGATDVREQADAGLRHREQRLFAHHRCEPWTETPTPPPITIPSISATYGFVKCLM